MENVRIVGIKIEGKIRVRGRAGGAGGAPTGFFAPELKGTKERELKLTCARASMEPAILHVKGTSYPGFFFHPIRFEYLTGN